MYTELRVNTQQVSPAVGRQIARMEQVITGLLQMSNLGPGACLQPADLAAALRQLEPGYQALSAESELHLSTDWPALPVTAKWYEHRADRRRSHGQRL